MARLSRSTALELSALLGVASAEVHGRLEDLRSRYKTSKYCGHAARR
jgi:hypothetical protein